MSVRLCRRLVVDVSTNDILPVLPKGQAIRQQFQKQRCYPSVLMYALGSTGSATRESVDPACGPVSGGTDLRSANPSGGDCL